MCYCELRLPLFLILPSLLLSVGARSTPLHKYCIASDGTSYSVTESWIPKLNFRTDSCITCTCHEDAIVKCKKTHCSMLSCSSDSSQDKCCSHCMMQLPMTNALERSPMTALPKPKVDKHGRKQEADTVPSMSPSRATHPSQQRETGLWRQRLIEFHEETTTTFTPKATTTVPLSRESAVLRLSYNRQQVNEKRRQPNSAANWRLSTKRMQTERRMRMSLTTYDRPTTSSSRNNNNLGFGDMTQIFSVFGLLKADTVTPVLQSSALHTLTPCRVEAPGEKVTKSQVYQHGDWWKTTLPILGENKCVKCTCESGEVKCRIPKCTPRHSLPCSKAITTPGKCCASCPTVITQRPLSPDVDLTSMHSGYGVRQKKNGCNGKFYPLIYRFIYEINEIDFDQSDLKTNEPKSYVVAIRQRHIVEIYNWTMGEDNHLHRRHVIRVRSSRFKRYNEMPTPGGEFQLWGATSDARLRKFEQREEKWSGSCKSRCSERIRRMVTRLLLKSPGRVKCAMLNHSDAVI